MVSSSASAQIFTDRAAFQTALGAFTVETFETAPLIGTVDGGSVPSFILPDFTVNASPSAVKVLDTPAPAASFNTTPGGSRYLYLDTDIGFQGTLTTFQFSSPLFAFGFDYTGHPALLFCQLGGQGFTLTGTSGATDLRFWGFIGASPFSTVSLDSNYISAYGIDQVTFAIVPEPSAVSVLVMGLCTTAVFARKIINRKYKYPAV